MIAYFIWNGSRELFSIGQFTLRWYALLLILAFLVSRQMLFYIYQKEGRPQKYVGTLTAWLLLGILLGARLGHVIFYEPELIRSKPIDIFFPFEFQPHFHFTAIDGFSVHGAAIGILVALWFYARKRLPGLNYIQVLDKVAILGAITAAIIFFGSFLNLELVGAPTGARTGSIFANRVTSGLAKLPCCIMRNPEGNNPLEYATVKKGPSEPAPTSDGHQNIILYLFFKPGATEQLVNEFLIGDVKSYLFDTPEMIYEPGTEPLHYTIFLETDGKYVARVRTIGIARHPVHLFEALTSLFLFVILFTYWNTDKIGKGAGKLFCFFMINFWTLHFAFGYMKAGQVPLGPAVTLTLEQLLSLIMALAGAVTLFMTYRGPATRS